MKAHIYPLSQESAKISIFISKYALGFFFFFFISFTGWGLHCQTPTLRWFFLTRHASVRIFSCNGSDGTGLWQCEHKPALTEAQRSALCSTCVFLKSHSASVAPHEGLTHYKFEPNSMIFQPLPKQSESGGTGDEQCVKSLAWMMIWIQQWVFTCFAQILWCVGAVTSEILFSMPERAGGSLQLPVIHRNPRMRKEVKNLSSPSLSW